MDFRTNFASYNIAQLIQFCLGITCNPKGEDILPKNVCESCLEKLKVAHELKTKGIESDRYLQNILLSQASEIEIDDHLLTPFDPPPPPVGLSDTIDDDDEDSLLQPVDEGTEVIRLSETSRQGKNYKEYSCAVCRKTFKYRKPYMNHLLIHPEPSKAQNSKKQAPYDSRSPYETPALYPVPDVKSDSPPFEEPMAPRGLRKGEFPCRVCNKSFRYQKALANHMKLHTSPLTPAIKRKLKRKYGMRRPQGSDKEDSPDDEDDDDGGEEEEVEMEDNRQGHESSPDLSGFMADNFVNYDQQESNNHKAPSKSPSPEPSVEQNSDDEEETPVKRSRGRPSKGGPKVVRNLPKISRGRGRPRKQLHNPKPQDDEPPEDVALLLEGFTEVDLSKVLKAKDTFDENSFSNSAPSTSRSRSRSSSVEIVQDFDIFGSPRALPPCRVTFGCGHEGCERKFHLRANLKKHRREDHGLT